MQTLFVAGESFSIDSLICLSPPADILSLSFISNMFKIYPQISNDVLPKSFISAIHCGLYCMSALDLYIVLEACSFFHFHFLDLTFASNLLIFSAIYVIFSLFVQYFLCHWLPHKPKEYFQFYGWIKCCYFSFFNKNTHLVIVIKIAPMSLAATAKQCTTSPVSLTLPELNRLQQKLISHLQQLHDITTACTQLAAELVFGDLSW